MVNSFHQIGELARKAFVAALEKNPEDRDSLILVRSHYGFNGFAHAMIHFITNRNPDNAITNILRERGMERQKARHVLTSAIENGPKAWLENFDFLYSKGVVVAGGRCFILPSELRSGTPYDTSFQKLSPDARKIAEKALGYAAKHGKKNFDFSHGPLTQQYLVVQLMNDGSEKDFRIAALSMNKDYTIHQKQMTNSAHAARYFAKEAGVDLERLNVVIKEGRAMETAPARKQPSSKSRMASMGAEANPRFVAANDIDKSTIKELRQSLKQIIGQNGITPVHAQLYFYLSNMSDEHVPTYEDAAKKFGVSDRDIPGIVQNIEFSLAAQQARSLPGLAIKR